MKRIEEIKWCEKYKGKEQEEYELVQFGHGIALCNGDYVPQDFIDLCDDLQVQVWEGKISEEEMDKYIEKILSEE